MSRLINPSATAAGTANTTDGTTATTIASFDISTLTNSNIPITVQAVANGIITSVTNQNNSGMAMVIRGFKQVSSTISAIVNLTVMGGLGGTVVSNQAPLVGDSGITTATVTIDFSGTVIRLRVIGIAATSITWSGALWITSGEF